MNENEFDASQEMYMQKIRRDLQYAVEAEQQAKTVAGELESREGGGETATPETSKPEPSKPEPTQQETTQDPEIPIDPETGLVKVGDKFYPPEDVVMRPSGPGGDVIPWLTPEAHKREQQKKGPTVMGQPLGEYNTGMRENLSAIGTGLGDVAVSIADGTYGMIANAMGIKQRTKLEIPEFENQEAQAVRDLSSIVLPNLLGMGAASTALKGVHATRVAQQGSNLTRLTRLGNDVAFKRFANIGLAGGVGFSVDGVAPVNERDHNVAGSFKEAWPQTWGWISDDIATLTTDSPEVKRQKNQKEGVTLSIGGDLIGSFARLLLNRKGVKNAATWLPENERAKKATQKLNNLTDETPEDVIIKGAERRMEELEELKEYNLTKSVDLDEPVFGYHDMYDDMEYGLRTSDEGGIMGASVDLVRIENNVDTVYGRLGSVFTESALKYGLDADQGSILLVKGLGTQLTEAGRYGYRTSNGKYMSFAQIDEAGTRLAADLVEMDVTDMKRLLDEFSSVDKETGAKELTSDAYHASMKAIKFYLSEYANMDVFKAAAYSSTSMAGQISDLAEGARLMDGSIAVNRAREQILDRIEYLTTVKAQTSYIRGRALNMLNTQRLNKFQRAGKGIADLVTGEEFAETFEEGLSQRARESKDFVDTLRGIQKERPEMLGPMMLAYEVTDGSVNSMSKLNNYAKNSTGTFSKAFFDTQSEIPSMFNQGVWANIYNSALSSTVTSTKTALSNSALLIERPVATFMGAAMDGDTKLMRRGVYQYRAVGETFLNATKHMWEVYKRASKDPTSVGYVMRDDIAIKNQESMDILRSFADSAEKRGEFGPSAMVNQIEELQALERHPWLRFGPNVMTALDGFTRSVIGSVEARGRAWDLVNGSNGVVDPELMLDISRKNYQQMFDKNGMISDKAVEYASREISMNLDGSLTQSLNEILKVAPVAKPFLMFPRTSSNMLLFAGSHNPAALFHKEWSEFGVPFEQMARKDVKELLVKRGHTYSEETAEMTYNTIRAELRGRKAIGAIAVMAGGSLFMANRLRGDGHHDKQTQRVRKDLGEKPRTVQGLDGRWYSYDNLGAITDWMALSANISDNVIRGTLDPNDAETLFSKMSFILASSITSKSFMAGLEPMGDVFSGNGAAISRWTALFGSSLAPLSGMRNDFSRLLTPQLKELDQEHNQLVYNRNPGLKDTLPDKYDYIDGGLVGEPEDVWTRIWNTSSPVKVSEEITPEKQFLIDIEFDVRPTLSTNGKGVQLTPAMRSAITQRMGEDKIFRDGIREVMQSTTAQEFRRSFREGAKEDWALDKRKWQRLHIDLNYKLRNAMTSAINDLDPKMSSEIKNLQVKQDRLDRAAEIGDLEEIRLINNYE